MTTTREEQRDVVEMDARRDAGYPPSERDAPWNARDQADRLAQLLYRRNAHARDLIGGSDAQILIDAIAEISHLRSASQAGGVPADSNVAFDAFAAEYDLESNEWLDMDVSEVFRRGWTAALSASPPPPATDGDALRDALVIHNGDHAEFEREQANTPPEQRPDWPLPSFYASDWAKAFGKLFIVSRIDGYATKPIDDQDGLMIGWFANALMRGFDEHAKRNALASVPTPVIRDFQITDVSGTDAVEVERAIECHKLDTPEWVFFYEQDFYVLSNFSAFDLDWKGRRFPTSEHAYHWEKFPAETRDANGVWVRDAIKAAASAHEAFKMAEAWKSLRRENWDAVKVDVMLAILREKADQHEYVRRKLLATGDRELIEDSWRDDFWGWGPNRDGQNMLGKLWMEIRTELRSRGTDGGTNG